MIVLDTVGKVLDRFDLLYPDNGLTESQKMLAITEADQRLTRRLLDGVQFPRHYYKSRNEKTLFGQFPHDDYYIFYLSRVCARSTKEIAEHERLLDLYESKIKAEAEGGVRP